MVDREHENLAVLSSQEVRTADNVVAIPAGNPTSDSAAAGVMAHCITLVCRILLLAVRTQVSVAILVHVSSAMRPYL